jgi:hypothetical protein
MFLLSTMQRCLRFYRRSSKQNFRQFTRELFVCAMYGFLFGIIGTAANVATYAFRAKPKTLEAQ